MKHSVKEFFEKETETWSYVVADRESGKAAAIDVVMGYQPETGRTRTRELDAILSYLDNEQLDLTWILETHAHADHLSGARYLAGKTGASVAIGTGITGVQAHFKNLFNLGSLKSDGSQFDRLLEDGDCIEIGGLELAVMATPGHTNDSVTYVMDGAAFIGDTLFMPDVGTARCDFPGGDAATLYDSVQRIFALPDATVLYMCHDYPTEGRGPKYKSTVAEQKSDNVHVGNGISKEDFVRTRTTRDKTLKAPRLILPSLQVNIRGGDLPEEESNGVAYMKIPLNRI